MHYTRWRVTGDPLTDRKPGTNIRRRKPDPSRNWQSAHRNVIAKRGPARRQVCRFCGKPASDWAYDNADPNVLVEPGSEMPYSVDVEHYMPLCSSCHKRFDNRHRARDVISQNALLANMQLTIDQLFARVADLEARLEKAG